MDYTNLLNDRSGRVSRVGVVGATKGYGYTLLAQIPTVAHMKLRVICSRHTDECLEVLKEIGYDEAGITVCNSLEDIKAASEDAILIVDDYRLVTECGITALVECTGNTAVSSDAALRALRKGDQRVYGLQGDRQCLRSCTEPDRRGEPCGVCPSKRGSAEKSPGPLFLGEASGPGGDRCRQIQRI